MNSRGNCVWLRSKLSGDGAGSRADARANKSRSIYPVRQLCAYLDLSSTALNGVKKAGEKRKAECEPGLDEVARYYPKALMSAGIAKYGIHLGQHQFNRCFAQNGSIRELAKEETSGFNTPRRDRLAHSSCLLVDVIPGQVCTYRLITETSVTFVIVFVLKCRFVWFFFQLFRFRTPVFCYHLGFYTCCSLSWLVQANTVKQRKRGQWFYTVTTRSMGSQWFYTFDADMH